MLNWFKKPIKDSVILYWELIKVMVPIMILVRLGVEFGLIEHISLFFTPLMDMVGLPPEAGIIWTTAMLVNIYAGMAALVGLIPDAPMTVAQITILGSMILIAHSLPIEQRIVQKAGPSFFATTALRVVGAMAYGAILNVIYKSLDFLQMPASIGWLPKSDPNAGWISWGQDTLVSLFTIFWVILVLVLVLKALDDLKITDWISKLLSPLLSLMGISNKAVPITMIGVMLGLSYGGALILREAKEGTLSPKDIFLSLSFMCLFHSLIEDTLLIAALGGHLSGILIGRFIFAFIVLFILGRLINQIPQKAFYGLLFKKA